MLVLVLVILYISFATVMLGLGLEVGLRSFSDLQSKTDERALRDVVLLNANDRAGQINNLVVRSRESDIRLEDGRKQSSGHA